jgi:predicted nucleic acid-binding protein
MFGSIVRSSEFAWHKSMRGRVPALMVLESRVRDLTRPAAELESERFDATGCRRVSTADCLIAGVAIGAGAELVTADLDGFAPSEPFGLLLAS